ncbi:MAG: hypothetical protein WD851_08265 [Pirellulales bacterium]
MTDDNQSKDVRAKPWRWVPSLYFAQGLPNVVVMSVSVIMFQRLGVSNAETAFYTSLLNLPWVIKPLWSPLVDVIGTKRAWIVLIQFLMAIALAGVAAVLPLQSFLTYSLVLLGILAFSSATHDIAADGFYMLALSSHSQAWFVGIRSTSFRLALVTGLGLLVMLAGTLESNTGLPVREIEVEAVESISDTPTFEIPNFPTASANESQQVLASPTALQISFRGQTANSVNSIVDAARNWNTQHNFYATEVSQATSAGQKPGWLAALESGIRRWFGPADKSSTGDQPVGGVGLVYLQLNRPVPIGEQIVVHLDRSSGDSNIRVIEGRRFVVNDANAGVPMAAVIQLDAKLDQPARATLSATSGNSVLAWSVTFGVLSAIFAAFFLYHTWALPHPAADVPHGNYGNFIDEFFQVFVSFFKKPGIASGLAFLVLYRFAEAQLLKIAQLFMLDTYTRGGLGLTTSEVGFVYGTVGVVALILGGILAGFAAARNGLRTWLPWMVLAINVPNVAYVFLAYFQPENYLVINLAVAIEQFGYGFGFAAYMLYMLYLARGEHQTAHYAICTGFMALGMMLPGMWSGWLQELIGYKHFFTWVILATIPSFLVTAIVYWNLDPTFGRREETP